MAPMDKPDHNEVEKQVKNVIDDLFKVMVQVSTYDTHPPHPPSRSSSSRDVLAAELTRLSESLRGVHASAATLSRTPGGGPQVPEVLVQYVENGRNPDIYTREFVELVRRMNQLARGKMRAFGAFRDTLAAQACEAMPELREDVRRVLEATSAEEGDRGGRAEGALEGAGAGAGAAGGGAAKD